MINEQQVTLRPTELPDLDHFFTFQLDEEASYLAAFTPENRSDKPAYLAKYTRCLADPTIHMDTILVGPTIAGSIAKFEIDGQAEITYWVDRRFWGQGVATTALKQFLATEPARPMRGRVAFDNIGSQQVLVHCGFVRVGSDEGFAHARQAIIEEYIYQLA